MTNNANKFSPKAQRLLAGRDQPLEPKAHQPLVEAEKPTIMVVDDTPQIGQMLTQFLGRHNHEVISFTSGIKALNHLKTNLRAEGGTSEAVGLLLTDMNMPEMTGIELARQAKILYPALPIIVMSGSVDGQDRDEIFKLGVDFIPKPFDFVDLLKRINLRLPTVPAGAPFGV
ncbi:MAG: response regulator [Planctomycetota bacterium]